jgi:hypothetical protein
MPEIFDGWWVIPTGPAIPVTIIPAIISSLLALLISQYIASNDSFSEIFSSRPDMINVSIAISLLLVFINAHDYWWWGDNSLWLLGLPKWIWWSLLLSAIQSLIFFRIINVNRAIN